MDKHIHIHRAVGCPSKLRVETNNKAELTIHVREVCSLCIHIYFACAISGLLAGVAATLAALISLWLNLRSSL